MGGGPLGGYAIGDYPAAITQAVPASTPATYIVEVDWNNDGDFSDAEEDITADVREFSCRRGRDFQSSLTARSAAGTLRVVLNNDDGKYSSQNTSSPIYGDILPRRRVRVRTTTPTPINLWQGWLDHIEVDSEAKTYERATLYAYGSLGEMQRAKDITPVASSGALTGTIMGYILDAMGSPFTALRTLDAGQTTTSRWHVRKQNALNLAREIEDTELGMLLEGIDAKIIFEDRHHRLSGAHLTSQATFSDAVGAARRYTAIRQSDPIREVFNKAEATVSTFAVAGLAVLWTLTGETPTLAPGESRTWWAEYPNQGDAGSTAWGVDAWTTPVVGTDVTQTGVANGDIAVAVSKFATSMKITVTNNNATKVATLTLVQARGTGVTRGDSTKVGADNAASQAEYGESPWSSQAPYLPNTSEAQNQVDYVVTRYGNASPRITIEVIGNTDGTHMLECLTRDISDRITIVATNKSKLGINGAYFIEAIEHTVNQYGFHKTRFECSPISAFPAWILGTSALGVNTYVAW